MYPEILTLPICPSSCKKPSKTIVFGEKSTGTDQIDSSDSLYLLYLLPDLLEYSNPLF
jgi:hypothetical protein